MKLGRRALLHCGVLLASLAFGVADQAVNRIGIMEAQFEEAQQVLSYIRSSFSKGKLELVSLNINETSVVSYKEILNAITILRDDSISVVIGQYSPVLACATEHLRIPYFITSIVDSDTIRGGNLIRLFPDTSTFVNAINDLVDYHGQKRVGILYNHPYGSVLIEKLLWRQFLEVKSLKVPADKATVSERTKKAIHVFLKQLRTAMYEQYVVLSDAATVQLILEDALTLSMLSRPYSWLIVNMGMDEIEIRDFADTRANLTLLQLMVDASSSSCALDSHQVSLTNAILHDAFAFSSYLLSKEDNRSSKFSATPYSDRAANKPELEGCTGHLTFEGNQTREEDFLQLVSLSGLEKELRGSWRSGPAERYNRIDSHKSYSDVARYLGDVFGHEPVRIVTKLEPPFVQEVNATEYLVDDPVIDENGTAIEGFCIDVLKEISRLLNFKYSVYFVPDGKFGSKKSYGWTGMIRQLIDKKADIALAPFSLTEERSSVVDFAKPFMTKGTTVVVKKPQRQVKMFQFLSPLSSQVWVAIFVSFLLVSLALFGVSRVNSDRRPKYSDNLRECSWYIWATLLRGSVTGAPTAVSSRIIGSAWWLFSLIVISVYTANLAAFLTITQVYLPIETAADLAYQDEYDYGTVDGSQIESFFNFTNITHFAKMWAYMSITPGSMVRLVDDGLRRARERKYAFIWDSPTLRYEIAEKCDLMEIGTPFDLKGYGFPSRKDKPYTEKISWAILKLSDKGVLQQLEEKWWRVASCRDGQQNAETQALELVNVAGMYVVMLGGIAISAIICSLIRCLDREKNEEKRDPSEAKDVQMIPRMSATDRKEGVVNLKMVPKDA